MDPTPQDTATSSDASSEVTLDPGLDPSQAPSQDEAGSPRHEPLLAQQRCLITGGTRGLGRAIALAMARQGARVAVTYHQRDEDAQQTLAELEALGAAPLLFKGCVSDAAHAEATVKALVQAWGGLDVLVNNAAITQILPIALLEEQDWDRVMAINVKGAYLFSRAALKPMIKARRGHILNIGAFAAERNVGAPVHFVASKAALHAFSHALAKEVGRYDIKVNCVIPGLLDGGMSARIPRHHLKEYREHSALGELVPAQGLAQMITWLVSPQNTMMTGGRVVIDHGL